MEDHISSFNYLSVQLLEYMGNFNPAQEQIDLIESLISMSAVKVQLFFNNQLNDKEIACLYWVTQGKSSRETAKLLAVNQTTVESHRKEIKRKLKCSSIAQAVYEGLRHGDIPINQKALPTSII